MCFGAKQAPTPTGGTKLPPVTIPTADQPVAPLDAPAATPTPTAQAAPARTTSASTGLTIPT